MSVDLGAVDAALEPLREGFEADGYTLKVLPGEEDRVTIAVEALEDACEECLVPEGVFRRMIDTALAKLASPPSYSVQYPATGEHA